MKSKAMVKNHLLQKYLCWGLKKITVKPRVIKKKKIQTNAIVSTYCTCFGHIGHITYHDRIEEILCVVMG